MNKFIIGTKQQMTQVYKEDGTVVPVTVVQVDPCTITQIKTVEADGYSAIQVANPTEKVSRVKKPQQGHTKALNASFKNFREFRVEDTSAYTVGDSVTLEQFEVGDKVKVEGVSKGRGYAGVVKRHGFGGQPATHGTKDQERMPGSIGATGPAHVFKGVRMPGRMGADQVTVANLEVIKVDAKNNQVFIKGAVPGHRGGLVHIFA